MNSYFFDGYVGVNEEPWGLYDVVHNRIILISPDCDCLLRVAMILTSKVQLYVVALHHSPNYTPNIVDNHCCLNWGLAGVSGDNLFSLPRNKNNIEINPVPNLIMVDSDLKDTHVELQKFAFLAHHVVQHWANKLDWYYRDYYDYIAWPQDQQQLKQQERAMYHAIYNGQDYPAVEKQIQSMLT